ncbi:hypothetical protein B9Z55_000500 [Caenorhabditis nigoni]|uniref:Uncharacterized protein n=1 Tax=Caenorhabditis nigoni TaxID=1611254 RepID=A0A2G5VTG6_9PELO|nr:hypothetical protein B9Z55_000500 [Caenorhabditis nigoni]
MKTDIMIGSATYIGVPSTAGSCSPPSAAVRLRNCFGPEAAQRVPSRPSENNCCADGQAGSHQKRRATGIRRTSMAVCKLKSCQLCYFSVKIVLKTHQ